LPSISNRYQPGEIDHPSPKPVKLMEWVVSNLDGETVVDPFCGSGTTGVACAKLGRKFIGIEIEPKYFDIACRRIEQAYAQPDMFVTPPAKPVQEAML
jgi:site-specific DNA-methyltransferase (adenine-specific)